MGYEALYEEDATQEEQLECYQRLINSGDAWRLEGHVGRTAMRLIEDGFCVLGTSGHRDAYGNRIPSRTEVQEGTKGSVSYSEAIHGKAYADRAAAIT